MLFGYPRKKLLARLRRQSDEIARLLPYHDRRNLTISLWSVGNQVEHILLSNLLILRQIDANLAQGPATGKPFNWTGRFVLWFGRFPRGKGKAPPYAKPKGASSQELKAMLAEVNKLLEQLEQKELELERSRYAFPHFIFGLLDVKQWLRLSEVHTRHHLLIVADILSH